VRASKKPHYNKGRVFTHLSKKHVIKLREKGEELEANVEFFI
jgi:hypothetical protein